MQNDAPNPSNPRRSFLASVAPRLRKSSSTTPLAEAAGAYGTNSFNREDTYSDRHPSSEGHHGPPLSPMSDLIPPPVPFAENTGGHVRSSARSDRADASSSRRSSFSSLRPRSIFSSRNAGTERDIKDKDPGSRPMSLSINYVPAKFAKLHAPGEYAHRRKGKGDEGLVKRGGGRSAFADDAGRMGAVGFVDDDYGTEYKVGKGGLKKKDKKKWATLRWNRFKWCLFVANTVVRLSYLAVREEDIGARLDPHRDVPARGARRSLVRRRYGPTGRRCR